MIKQCLIFVGLILMVFTPFQSVRAKNAFQVEEMYVTTEDILEDILYPTVDKRVAKEYRPNTFLDWNWKRIVGVNYNNNHSYDVAISIKVSSDKNRPHSYSEDLVKVRVYPSCDSPKIGCNHGFKIAVLDYKHLSQ